MMLFAESDKDFVDVLFGFLTLPLGTVVRLLGKESQAVCLDALYKSVEDLSTDYFQTKACKAMLLKPLNAAAKQCRQLKSMTPIRPLFMSAKMRAAALMGACILNKKLMWITA
ncbi:hypothetical protein E2562_014829 [Oryza meyeriana var. granulata]|uniref:Uncharacterized protein n=1 Tax=Oryza meyeriana var. granulata TaxID=110450 RepID=A0A6G1BX75_9ORYZ|nr:hypothetical protein E2562_014829 [Oryza meyeriana var. granulata]